MMPVMARLYLALIVGMLAGGSFAVADPALRKAASVREQGFSLPLDFKTEPDTKLRGSLSDPPGLVSAKEPKARYFGMGITRSLEPGK
jgi:hypothetical protein